MKIYHLFIGIVFLLSSCIKGDCKYTAPIDPYLKQKLIQQPGSYWIYEDTFGNYDSSWIADSWFGTLSPNCNEQYIATYFSNQDGNAFKVMGMGGNSSSLIYYNYKNYGASFCFEFKASNGQVDTSKKATSPCSILTNYAVNKYNFAQAISVSTNCSSLQSLVFVPEVGIVEKIVATGDTFKLTNYLLK